jgi:RNA polymerase sigma factor (TIGR02999 family)
MNYPGSEVNLKTGFKKFYDELSEIAHKKLQYERANNTLDTSALVHEAFFHLNKQDGKPFLNRPQFIAVAAITMRRILVNYARQHNRLKRKAEKISLTYGQHLVAVETTTDEILALHESLKMLNDLNPRQAKVVEYYFFGGFKHEEIAEVLEVSIDTIRRDWRLAKAWLSIQVKAQV